MFISHSEWDSYDSFKAWTDSDAFKAAHGKSFFVDTGHQRARGKQILLLYQTHVHNYPAGCSREIKIHRTNHLIDSRGEKADFVADPGIGYLLEPFRGYLPSMLAYVFGQSFLVHGEEMESHGALAYIVSKACELFGDLLAVHPALTGSSIRKMRKLVTRISERVPFSPDMPYPWVMVHWLSWMLRS